MCLFMKSVSKRDFKVQNYLDAFEDIPQELMGDYEATSRDREIILERIAERLSK